MLAHKSMTSPFLGVGLNSSTQTAIKGIYDVINRGHPSVSSTSSCLRWPFGRL